MVLQQASYTDRFNFACVEAKRYWVRPVCNNLIHDERTCGEDEILPFFLSQGSRIEMSASNRTLIVVVFSLTLMDVLALCPSTEVQPGFLFSCELRKDDIFSAVDVAKGKSLVIRRSSLTLISRNGQRYEPC